MGVIPKLNTIDGNAVPLPSELSVGELALNAVSGKLYTKRTSGTVTLVYAQSVNQLSGGTEETTENGTVALDSSVTGQTGSVVTFAKETDYKGTSRNPFTRPGGTVEAVGRARDTGGNPLSASISVTAYDYDNDAYIMAANGVGDKIAMQIYGPDQPDAETFAGVGAQTAVIHSTTTGGIAIGVDTGLIGQAPNVVAVFDNDGISTSEDITANGTISAGRFHGPINPTYIDDNGASYGDVLFWDGADWTPTAVSVNASLPVTSVSGRIGAIVLTKSDVGLSNVDNTSDADKPVSTATQAAISDFVNSDATLVTGSSRVENIVVMSESAYLSLTSVDANTIYFLT